MSPQMSLYVADGCGGLWGPEPDGFGVAEGHLSHSPQRPVAARGGDP